MLQTIVATDVYHDIYLSISSFSIGDLSFLGWVFCVWLKAFSIDFEELFKALRMVASYIMERGCADIVRLALSN
jgi:hypothetical protein